MTLDRVASLLETELARPAYRPGISIENLLAKATIAERWSAFKDPDFAPEQTAPSATMQVCPSPPTPLPRSSESSTARLF